MPSPRAASRSAKKTRPSSRKRKVESPKKGKGQRQKGNYCTCPVQRLVKQRSKPTHKPASRPFHLQVRCHHQLLLHLSRTLVIVSAATGLTAPLPAGPLPPSDSLDSFDSLEPAPPLAHTTGADSLDALRGQWSRGRAGEPPAEEAFMVLARVAEYFSPSSPSNPNAQLVQDETTRQTSHHHQQKQQQQQQYNMQAAESRAAFINPAETQTQTPAQAQTHTHTHTRPLDNVDEARPPYLHVRLRMP